MAHSLATILEEVEKGTGPLTVSDLARITGKSAPAIYKAISEGKIETVNDGIGGIRIDRKTYSFMLRHKNPGMRTAAKWQPIAEAK